MKYAFCGRLVGLSDTIISTLKQKLDQIPKADYWLRDAEFRKFKDENGDNVLTFRIPFHKKQKMKNLVSKWIEFYTETKVVTNEDGTTAEIKERKFRIKDSAVKTLWSKCKTGSTFWVELHEHDEASPRGCQIIDIAKK